MNPTRRDTRQSATHSRGTAMHYFRSRLSCGDPLGAREHSGDTGDARQTTISLNAEATDRAVSFSYVKEAAIAAQSHVDEETSCAVEAATASSSARLPSSETL